MILWRDKSHRIRKCNISTMICSIFKNVKALNIKITILCRIHYNYFVIVRVIVLNGLLLMCSTFLIWQHHYHTNKPFCYGWLTKKKYNPSCYCFYYIITFLNLGSCLLIVIHQKHLRTHWLRNIVIDQRFPTHGPRPTCGPRAVWYWTVHHINI